MKKVIFLIIWSIGLLLVSMPVSAQRVVNFSADDMRSISGRPGFSRLDRNVIIQHEGMTVRSNSAIVNQATNEFEAYDNLRIRTKEGATITGKTLRNYPQQKAMVVEQNVIFTDTDSTQLFTDRLVYNQISEISTYTTGGRIVSDSTVLTSLIGHYHGKTKAFHCKTDVVIEHPDYTIRTDTLQMFNDVIYFFSPTHVWSDSNYMYCEHGWYKVKEKIASLTENAYIQTKEQKMYGDSIYYEMETDFGMAFENVTVIDSANDIIIHCDFAYNDKRRGDAWFTKNAVGIVISDNDSLYLRGDTLRIAYDSNQDVSHMLAYNNVLFFRDDMQGACDSLAYMMADSTMTMFGTPIVWAGNDQLTGDTIRVLTSGNRPTNAYLLNRAFIISKGHHEGHFNQVKGREVEGFFNDSSELERVFVNENVETIYFVTDDVDNSLIGIIKGNSEQLQVMLENRTIVDILYIKPDEAGSTMFTDVELPKQDRFLKGFLWQDERRPKSKFDVWPNAPKSLDDELFDFLKMMKDLETPQEEQWQDNLEIRQKIDIRE